MDPRPQDLYDNNVTWRPKREHSFHYASWHPGILRGEDKPRCSIAKSPNMFIGSIVGICLGDSPEGPAEGMLGNKPFNASTDTSKNRRHAQANLHTIDASLKEHGLKLFSWGGAGWDRGVPEWEAYTVETVPKRRTLQPLNMTSHKSYTAFF